MKKVYVVTRGEYSDYHIVAIFDTKEKAQECCAVFNDADVTEYELDSFGTHDEVYNYKVYVSGDQVCNPGYIGDIPVYFKPNTIQRVNDSYLMIVMAKNVEHARKVAADKYAMFKAVKDTHFQLIDKECVERDSYLYRYCYPVYDMTTFEILLADFQYLREGYTAATRIVERKD